MAKASKKRSRTWVWVIGLLASAFVMAALGSGLLSGLCLWSAIILAIVAAMKASPKPAAGQTSAYDYEDLPDDTNDERRRREWERDRKREEEYFQDSFDAEQREHEDRGEV